MSTCRSWKEDLKIHLQTGEILSITMGSKKLVFWLALTHTIDSLNRQWTGNIRCNKGNELLKNSSKMKVKLLFLLRRRQK